MKFLPDDRYLLGEGEVGIDLGFFYIIDQDYVKKTDD